jgi:Putative Actinobacterial Holin-X, holin superfamily III
LHPDGPGDETRTPEPERSRVADNPQQSVRELKDLVVAYAKQETADPLKGLKRYVTFGLGGALLMGTGIFFLAMGVLRALQANHGWAVHGNWSWVPYVIDVLVLGVIAGLAWMARTSSSQRKKKKESVKQ